MADDAHFSTGHEHTQYNRVRYFHLFGVIFASEGSNYSELFSQLQLVLCRVAAVNCLSVHHHSSVLLESLTFFVVDRDDLDFMF